MIIHLKFSRSARLPETLYFLEKLRQMYSADLWYDGDLQVWTLKIPEFVDLAIEEVKT